MKATDNHLTQITQAFLAEDWGQVSVALAQAKQQAGEGLVSALTSQLWKLAWNRPFSETQITVLSQFYPVEKANIFWGTCVEKDWEGLYQANHALFLQCAKNRNNLFPMAKALMGFAKTKAEVQLLAGLKDAYERRMKQTMESGSSHKQIERARTNLFTQAVLMNNKRTFQWLLSNGGTWRECAEGVGLAYSARQHAENFKNKAEQVAELLGGEAEIDWQPFKVWVGADGAQLLKARISKQTLELELPENKISENPKSATPIRSKVL